MADKTRKNRRTTARSSGRESATRSGGASSAEIGARGKWTATGAARTARDARIGTAAHLRTAPVAQQWEMTRLMSAFQVWRQHLAAQMRQLRL